MGEAIGRLSRELPFSSTLNGSCSNVCRVKINIHEQIYAWRGVMDEKHQIKLAEKSAMAARKFHIAGDTGLNASPYTGF